MIIPSIDFLIALNLIIFASTFWIYELFYSIKYKKIKTNYTIYSILLIVILIAFTQFFDTEKYNLLSAIIAIILLASIPKTIFLFSYIHWEHLSKYKKTVIAMLLVGSIPIFYGNYIVIKNIFVNSQTEYFVSISNEQIINIISEDKYNIIYIARPTCPKCAIVEPLFIEIAQANRVTVYYFNTDIAREQNNDKMTQILEMYEVRMVPTILYTRNGEILYLYDTLNTEDIVENFRNLIIRYLEDNN